MKNDEVGMTPACPTPAVRGRVSTIVHRQSSIVHFARLLVAALREIFDESAYSRFLARKGLPATGESFRAFQRENALRRERRARCC